MSDPEEPGHARRRLLGLAVGAIVAVAACQSGSARPTDDHATGPTMAPPAVALTGSTTTAAVFRDASELRDGAWWSPNPAPPAATNLEVRWRGASTAVITWTEIHGPIARRVLVRESAPFDGSCTAAPYRTEASGVMSAASTRLVTGLVPGRCYRWSLTLVNRIGDRTVTVSAPIFRSWAGGPRDWYPGERNHLWLPAVGIDQAIHDWPCTRSGTLANVVYDWGCAGANNRYLMGHAYGVFRQLLAGYPGRLEVGQVAWVADANGNLIRYRLRWAVTMPKTTAWTVGKWVFAATPTPVLTLQTCYGSANDQFLFVRFDPA